MCETCGCGGETRGLGVLAPRLLSVEQAVLGHNDRMAARVREHLEAAGVLSLNLISSPGSGKTTLLVATLELMKDRVPMAVIEGDQQTSLDADRVAATGVRAVQINTGKGCHLEAEAVHRALHDLPLPAGGVLFIENVGNLVCPALFDLGEAHKVVVVSVTEGDDKPAKYPHIFAAADLLLVNKVDLLPYVDFDMEHFLEAARRLNPGLPSLALSARTGEGMGAWTGWLEGRLRR